MNISNQQKLIILNHAKDVGIDPSRVIFNGVKTDQSIHLRYRIFYRLMDGAGHTSIRINKSPYYFKMLHYGTTPNSIQLTYSPSKDAMRSHFFIKVDKNESRWKRVFTYISSWLNTVKVEFDSIQDIAKLVSIPEIIDIDDESEFDNFFNSSEVRYINTGLDNIKKGVTIEFDLNDYKLNLILSKLNELQEKVTKQNKFDFKSAFWGVLINITSSILYDNSGKFWNLVKESFPNLLK